MEHASAWAKAQGIRSCPHWVGLRKSNPEIFPSCIPAAPASFYGEAFKSKGGWAGFLGTSSIPTYLRKYRPLEEAHRWAIEQKIITRDRWLELRRTDKSFFPDDIPSTPNFVYGKSFVEIGGWAGFLRNGEMVGESFIERCIKRVFADIFSCHADDKCKISSDGGKLLSVDMACHDTRLVVEYDGSYYHKAKVEKDTAKTKNLTSGANPWLVVRIRGGNLPLIDRTWDMNINEHASTTQQILAIFNHINGLVRGGLIPGGMGLSLRIEQRLARLSLADFFDVPTSRPRATYQEAKAWAIAQKIVDQRHWWRLRNENPDIFPADIPSNPNKVYADVFTREGGWGGFLGTGAVAAQHKKFKSFEGASQWAQSQNIKNQRQWLQLRRSNLALFPCDIPGDPAKHYGVCFYENGGWGGFLATGVVAKSLRQYRSLKDARKWALTRKFSGRRQWFKARAENPEYFPADIPGNPYGVYGEAFTKKGGWAWFLGNK